MGLENTHRSKKYSRNRLNLQIGHCVSLNFLSAAKYGAGDSRIELSLAAVTPRCSDAKGTATREATGRCDRRGGSHYARSYRAGGRERSLARGQWQGPYRRSAWAARRRGPSGKPQLIAPKRDGKKGSKINVEGHSGIIKGIIFVFSCRNASGRVCCSRTKWGERWTWGNTFGRRRG